MDNQQPNQQTETTAAEPSKRKQNFYAIVELYAGPGEQRQTRIVEATNRTLIRKAISEDRSIAGVLAIFRGHKLNFETKKDINFN
jgi:hypothetical protein